MKQIQTILVAVILSAAGSSATVWTDTNGQAGAGFQYQTSRLTPADITLAANGGQSALLSFYSEGANGLRLLQNAFTTPLGRYVGEVLLPAHLSQVVVVVRTAERQDTLTLPINGGMISYAE